MQALNKSVQTGWFWGEAVLVPTRLPNIGPNMHLHFYWGSSPTVEHPDPIDATASPAQVSNTNSDVTVMLVNRHRVRDQTNVVTTIRLASYLASACKLRRRYTIRFARTEPADCTVHGSIVTCDMSLECPGHVKIG